MDRLHAIVNLEFGTPAAPENPGVLPTPVVARPPGLMEMIWHIEPIPDSPCYYISADRGHAIDNNGTVFLSTEREKWMLITRGDSVYSIVKCSERERGWLLENGQLGTPVRCVPLPPGPPPKALWRIEPPPPPPALQD